MVDLIKFSKDYFLSRTSKIWNNKIVKEIIKTINEEKIVIISWIYLWWKEYIVSELIKKTSLENNFLYINKALDIDNTIYNIESFKAMIEIESEKKEKAKIIIIENLSYFEEAKEFLKFLIKDKKYKIIIIWNDIKINSVKEINIKPLKINKISNYKIHNILKYWVIEDCLKQINQKDKELFLNYLKNEILIKDIMWVFKIRDINLYVNTMTFLSNLNEFLSLRWLYNIINNKNKFISLTTLREYIEISEKANIIDKMYSYDLQKSREINAKVKYFFTDNWIRNSFYLYNLDNFILSENIIFNEYRKLWYRIYSWINGKFNFSFLVKMKTFNIYIHLSRENDKNEIKKEAKKLLKIWDKFPKYLIVDSMISWRSIKDLWIKKRSYDSLKIMSLEEFIREIR